MKLPRPNIPNTYLLRVAFENRKTTRRFESEDLSVSEISNILYAAAGEVKPKTKNSKSKRTIPSARNAQCVSVLVVTKDGIYLYDETTHSINILVKGNHLNKLTSQSMMHNARFGLLYVADFNKLSMYTATDEVRMHSVAAVEVGCMSQNVSLYCAAANLGSVLVGLVKREYFHELLQLKNKTIMYSQIIGKKRESI